MRAIELGPVKDCLPVLRSPGTDHGDTAHTHAQIHTNTYTHTLYKHRKVLTPNSKSPVAAHYRSHSNKEWNQEKEVTQWGVWVAGSLAATAAAAPAHSFCPPSTHHHQSPQPHFFFCPLKLFWASDCVPTTKKKQLLAAADADEFHGVLPGLVQSN